MVKCLTASVFENQAFTLLLRLEAEGFEMQVAEPNILRVRPIDRVTPELRADLQRHKWGLLTLIRTCDTGVQGRREAFGKQLAKSAPGVLVPRLVFREAPYVSGRCHACGEALECARWGCCWRCAIARRLASDAPVSAELFTAYDEARICS